MARRFLNHADEAPKIFNNHVEKDYFRCVRINDHMTGFWRYQGFDLFHLSTIEAVYWAVREFLDAKKSADQCDDLLFYFKYQVFISLHIS
ncbi:hypothetical protein HK096_004038, partial [Nowakowskiella sp. JEL0078]